MRNELRIGSIGLVALIILLLLIWYFYYVWATHRIYADFHRATGISRLNDVTMAGIRIGTVWDISLTRNRRARVSMLIRNRYRNLIPTDSTAQIIPPNLIAGGKYSLDITPGTSPSMVRPQEFVQTEETPELIDLLSKAETLTGTMQNSFNSVDKLLGDAAIRRALRNTILNMEIASRRSVILIGGMQSMVSDNDARIPRILSCVDATASNFSSLSRDLKRLAAANGPVLRQTTEDISKGAQNFRTVSEGLKSAMRTVKPADLAQMMKNTQSTAEDLAAVSKRLRGLAEDPALSIQGQVMVANLQKAIAGAAQVVNQVKKLLEAKAKSTP